MAAQRSAWLGIVILATAVAVSVAVGDAGWWIAGDGGVGLGLLIAGTALGAAAYRRARDPALLFVTTGVGVVAAQGVGSLLDAIVSGPSLPMIAGAPASLASRAVLAACLVLAVPRGERRGRPAPDVRGVVVSAVVATVLLAIGFDLIGVGEPTTAVHTLLPVIAVAFGLVAAAVMLGARTRFGWWAAAAWSSAVLTVAIAASLGREPELVLLGLSVQRAAAICEGAFVLAGMLAVARVEASRTRRASDRAQEVLGGRAEIASMLAHELKGPIATIKGLAATTAGSYDKLSDDERREFVALIQDEAARLLDVVDQTSLALKIDAGTLTLDRRRHDLADIVRDAVDAADLPGRDVDTSLDDGVAVVADRRWLTHAIRQGLDNAVRFSPSGSPIGVMSRLQDHRAVVEIVDRGPGVPPERRGEVFTRFVRWRPPGYEDRQGSGLGLFICRGILAEHAGDASLEARPGGGTMLRLTIPVDPIPVDEPPPMEG